MILYLYWNLLNSIPEQNASITFSFPSVLKKGNKLPSVSRIKKMLLIYYKTDDNSIFDVHNPKVIKLLNRLRLNLSHLTEHKFRHNIRVTVNPFCLCNAETEITSHYLLRCPLFSVQRMKLLESHSNLDNTLLNHCDDDIVNILLYGSSRYSFSTNNKILSLTAEFSESTKRFHKPLF